METKFYTEKGVLDLSFINFSTQEQNSMMSDKTFTKFFFPFKVQADDEFIRILGDLVSDESKEVNTVIEGPLFHENKTFLAKLEIQDVEGYEVTGQIDYGLEEIPNFDKKLNELPLDKFPVDDIHVYAQTVIQKKWPQTNFNFPRIYTTKYDPSSAIWTSFDGYYNDTVVDNGVCTFKKNEIDSNGHIFNRNIIHPCPHPIYLLKAGFRDAGYELLGDILSDPDLQQRWIFSGTEYFSMKSQTNLDVSATPLDFDTDQPFNVIVNGTTMKMRRRTYNKTVGNLPKGNYKFIGKFDYKTYNNSTVTLRIAVNGVTIYEFVKFYDHGFINTINLNISSYLNKDTDNYVTFFADYVPINENAADYNIIQFELFSDILTENNSGSDDTKVVSNNNEINLTRAVPDITFGDYVNCIKNWFNYDIDVFGTKIYMNRIGKTEPSNVRDFREFAVKFPKKSYLKNRSFLLKFPDMDKDYKLDSMYYDVNGSKINGTKKTDTTEIEIKGYPLPVLKPKENAVATAVVKKDSSDIVGLVYYDGLTGGQNNSRNVPGCSFPELFDKNFRTWLRQRVRGMKYEWKKKVNMERFSQVSVKDYIFCNNNIHLIVSLNKDKIGDNTYEVNIVTETIN